MLKARSEQNEAKAALTSALQLLSTQIPREYPLAAAGLIVPHSALVGLKYRVDNSQWTDAYML